MWGNRKSSAAVRAALAAIVALLALPTGASAEVHQPLGAFCEPTGLGTPPCAPSFVTPEEMAVDSSGDLLVVDAEGSAGQATISRFKPNGEPDPFTALGTDVIDGKRSGASNECPTVPADCDETPQNGLSVGEGASTQIAVAPPTAGSTAGDIYLTDRNSQLINIFAPDGHYLGQLTESSSGPFSTLICGVAVDPDGAVYVSGFSGVFKFANPPVNGVTTADFTTVEFPCGVAAGTGPSAGSIFVNKFFGPTYKLDSTSGELEYEVSPEASTTVSVNAATGRLYVAAGEEVEEYDASGPVQALLKSTIETGPPPAPLEGLVAGVAASSGGDVYLSAFSPETGSSPNLGVWGPPESQPPTIEDELASTVTATEATVRAEVGAEGAPTTFHVDYVDEKSFDEEGGFSSPHTMHTADRSAGEASAPVMVSETLADLAEGTTYHWRLVATNSCATCGTTDGEDRTFTTFREHPPTLPDERLWEMVSSPEKLGAEVAVPGNAGGQHEFSVRPQQASPDGEAITYASFTSFGEAEGAGFSSQYVSHRGAGGWSTENVTPTFEEGYARDPLVGFSPDLIHSAIISRDPPLATGAQPHLWNLYRRDGAGAFATISAGEPEFTANKEYCVAFAGASTDYGRVIFAVRGGRLHPQDPPLPAQGTAELYEWTPAGGPVLASVLPGGAAAPPTATSSFGAAYQPPGWGGVASRVCAMEGVGGTVLLRHAISSDGQRFFWTFGGEYENAAHETVARPLLARLGGSETVQLDAPNGGVAGPGGEGIYRDAAVDGSRVLFTDGRALTVDSQASGGPDLYLYDFEKPAGSRLSDLTSAAPGDVQGVIGADAAGGSAYFVATGALTGAEENANHEQAESGKLNLYAWHEGETRFVAQLANSDQSDWSAQPQLQTARVSPDGRYVAFVSRRSLTGYDNTPLAATFGCEGGCAEVFRYDRQSGELSCVSCNPGNVPPLGSSSVPSWATPYEQPRYLLDDGRVFFQSKDTLESNDRNGETQDVYEFDPAGVGGCSAAAATFSATADGCVGLISSGESESDSYFLDASVSGRDAFISTRERLVPQLDKDSNSDVYDARVGGSPPPAQAATCESEGCRGAGTSPGPVLAAGTAAFAGPGNPGPHGSCGAFGHRAAQLSRRAGRLRRNAKRAASRGRAKQLRHRAGRLAGHAHHLSTHAKRCRRTNRRAAR